MIFFLKQTCHSQTGGRGGGAPPLGKIPTFSRFFCWGASLSDILTYLIYKKLGHQFNSFSVKRDKNSSHLQDLMVEFGGQMNLSPYLPVGDT